MKLSIVIGFRNRDLKRVRRCMTSLSDQSNQNFELIFVNYGSDTALAEQVSKIVHQYTFCRYVYSDTRGYPWSRAHALNIGIRLAQGEFVLTTDIDFVFANNFVDVILANVKKNAVLYSFVYFLPEKFDDFSNISKYHQEFKTSNRDGMGGCCCLEKIILEDIGGFDEYYRYWGIEDEDLHSRLKIKNIEEIWLEDSLTLYHQWHQPYNHRSAYFMPDFFWGKARIHFNKSKAVVKRNRYDWGGIIDSSKRTVLKYLDFSKNVLLNTGKIQQLDYNPLDNESVYLLIENFFSSPPGSVLAIYGSHYPIFVHSRSTDLFFSLIDRYEIFKRRFEYFDYKQNVLHNSLFQLILECGDMIEDYYLNFSYKNGVSLIIRK